MSRRNLVLMTYRREVMIAMLVLGSLSLVSVAYGAQRTTITDLAVAKTQQRIYASGTVMPPRPRGSVVVKLFRDVGTGFERIGRERVPLSDARAADGNGDKESGYRSSFPRPSDGTCKLLVMYEGNTRSASSSDEHVFPCGIPQFGSGSGTITSDSGTVDVDLMIAETDEQRGYGLMYRKWLAPDLGMVFLWPDDSSSSFYMRNTVIPLSIAFFDQAGRILRILDMAPCDDDEPNCPLYSPETSYRGALEVNQGAFAEWGVAEGDTIVITR